MHRRTGVIKVGTLTKIRRLYFRDKLSIREISRQTGMSRNTLSNWLREPEIIEPKYPARVVVTKLDAYADTLRQWLKADSGRGKRMVTISMLYVKIWRLSDFHDGHNTLRQA
jgi:IS30 family transposase